MAEMVRHQNPLIMSPGATAQGVWAAIHLRRVGAVLIAKEHKLLGIFTGRDAIHALAVGLNPECTMVDQAMTAQPCSLGPHHHAHDALCLMEDGGFRHLPSVHDGQLLGIVSRYDFRAQEQRLMDEETGFFEVIR